MRALKFYLAAFLFFVVSDDGALLAQNYGDAPMPYPTCCHLDTGGQGGTRIDVIGYAVTDCGFQAGGRAPGGILANHGDDGIEFISFNKGGNATVKVAIIQTGTNDDLCVWMDFNNDGDWDDAGERVIWAGKSPSAPNGAFAPRVFTPGSSNTSFNTYTVAIPANAVGTSCKVRARLWDTGYHASGPMAVNGGGSVSGLTDFGECEDDDVPYGTSTGSKPDCYVYDNQLLQTTTHVTNGGTDNRGAMTAGVQATIYYGINCLAPATHAFRFSANPTASITPISNCTVTPFIVPGGGVTMEPGDPSYFVIIFGITPTTQGMPFSATITMYTNDPITPNYTWTVAGNAVPPAPKIELQRPAYTLIPNNSTDNVGSIATSGQTLLWTIVNSGTAALNLTGAPAVQLSGFNNCSAAVNTQPATALPAGGYWTQFDVQIVPASAAAFSFTMTIQSNDAARSPYTITVAGNGGGSGGGSPNMGVQRSAAISSGATDNLGTLTAGAGSSFNYTIVNSGSAALTLTGAPSVSLSGLSNCTVAVTTQPAASIAAGGSTSFVLQVTPTASGAFSCVISIANNDVAKNPYVINISGTGSSTAAPEIDVQRGGTITSGGTDSAGAIALGSNTNLTYTIANLGTSALTVSGVSIGTMSNCTAALTTQPAASVAPGATTTFTVSITPGAGPLSFVISIVSNDSNENLYLVTVQASTATSSAGNTLSGTGGGGGCTAGSSNSGMICLVLTVLAGWWLRRRLLQA